MWLVLLKYYIRIIYVALHTNKLTLQILVIKKLEGEFPLSKKDII